MRIRKGAFGFHHAAFTPPPFPPETLHTGCTVYRAEHRRIVDRRAVKNNIIYGITIVGTASHRRARYTCQLLQFLARRKIDSDGSALRFSITAISAKDIIYSIFHIESSGFRCTPPTRPFPSHPILLPQPQRITPLNRSFPSCPSPYTRPRSHHAQLPKHPSVPSRALRSSTDSDPEIRASRSARNDKSIDGAPSERGNSFAYPEIRRATESIDDDDAAVRQTV